jgi:hypothetical protein
MHYLELFNVDLTSWKLTWAYHLELDHSLMGFFPAEFKDEDRRDIIVCLDPSLLAQVGSFLKPRECKIVGSKVLANESESIAFDLSVIVDGRYDDEPIAKNKLTLFTSDRLNKLMDTEHRDDIPFRWSPGLYGGRSINTEEFKAMIQRSLDKAIAETALPV